MSRSIRLRRAAYTQSVHRALVASGGLVAVEGQESRARPFRESSLHAVRQWYAKKGAAKIGVKWD
jgi:hypothetical protein